MNWEVNVGSLLVVASVIFSAGGFYAVSRRDSRQTKIDLENSNKQIKTDLEKSNLDLKEDITDIKADLKTLNKVVVDIAVQNKIIDNLAQTVAQSEKRTDERFAGLERRWEEIRRGEGLIEKRPA